MADKIIYKFKPGSRIKGDATAIGDELERIRSEYGGLTAANVVKAAADKSSVLHRYFTWKDKDAAESYRLQQASHLIAAVVVIVQKSDGTSTAPVRAYAAIGERADRYLSVLTAMSEPESRRLLLEQAVRELRVFESKYHHLKELADIFREIDRVAA